MSILLILIRHTTNAGHSTTTGLSFRLKEEKEVTLYCDLHGHSRKQNVFMYGCEDRQSLQDGFRERVFPMMMSKNCEDKVSFSVFKS